jgi:hypothetical protein
MTSGLVSQSEGTITAASSSFSMSTMGAMTLAGQFAARGVNDPNRFGAGDRVHLGGDVECDGGGDELWRLVRRRRTPCRNV